MNKQSTMGSLSTISENANIAMNLYVLVKEFKQIQENINSM